MDFKIQFRILLLDLWVFNATTWILCLISGMSLKIIHYFPSEHRCYIIVTFIWKGKVRPWGLHGKRPRLSCNPTYEGCLCAPHGEVGRQMAGWPSGFWLINTVAHWVPGPASFLFLLSVLILFLASQFGSRDMSQSFSSLFCSSFSRAPFSKYIPLWRC